MGQTQFEVYQIEWVRNTIEAGYERACLVNTPLIQCAEVPPFPPLELVIKSALKQITLDQLVYMMEESRPGFSFHIKLLTPSNRLDLQKILINGQPKRMNTPKEMQQDLYIHEAVEKYLLGRPCAGKIEWRWEFIQADQLLEETLKGEHAFLGLAERLADLKKNRPLGMRGIDRYSWAALMADSLEKAKPLDISFKDDATNTPEYEKWFFTVLDEEGPMTEHGYASFIGGRFRPHKRLAYLMNGYSLRSPRSSGCFRTSLCGPVGI